LRLLVTEHQVETKICDCGHRNKAAFPADVNAPVQYGERIKAAAICLRGYQTIPYERGCELLSDLFGCTLCQGTLANIIAQADGLAADPVEGIREQITQAARLISTKPGHGSKANSGGFIRPRPPRQPA